jgi:hypothetical protein
MSARTDFRYDIIAGIVFLGAAIGAALVIWHAGRHSSFAVDDWSFIEYRRSGIAPLWVAYNGNLVAGQVLAYRLLFGLFGISSYGPYRALVLAAHLACATVVFAYARRRVGPVFALAAAILVLFLAPAAEVMYFTDSALAHSVAPLCGLVALLCLDFEGRRPAMLAGLGFALALITFASALPLIVGVALELALRKHWKRLLLPIVPLLLYALWFVALRSMSAPTSMLAQPGANRVDAVGSRGQATGASHNLHLVLRYIDALASGTVGALTHSTGTLAHVLGAAFLVALLASLAWLLLGIRRGGLSWLTASTHRTRWLTLAVALILLWGLDAITRAQYRVVASRYLYQSAILVVLIVAETAGIAKHRIRSQVVIRASLGASILAVIFAVTNLGPLRRYGELIGSLGTTTRAGLGALELTRSQVAPSYAPAVSIGLIQVTAGPYFAATARLGSPALSPWQLRRASENDRQVEDTVLIGGLGLRPVRESRDYPRIRCTAHHLNDFASPVAETLHVGGFVIHNEARRALSLAPFRFADRPSPVTSWVVRPGQTAAVMIPADTSAVPWRVTVTGRGQFQLCDLPAPTGSQ